MLMTTRCLGFVTAVVLLVVSPATAQNRFALPTPAERHAADVASWITAFADVALDTGASWRRPDRQHAFIRQGERVAVTYGAVFAAKLLIHRRRPCAPSCGSDNPNYSFFSGHTAVAFSTIGGPRLSVALPLSTATGALRLGANKHWLTDVLAGAGVGALTSRIR